MFRLRCIALGTALALMASLTMAGAADKVKKPKPPKTPPASPVEISTQLVPGDLLDKLTLNDEQKEKVGKLQKEFEEKTQEGVKKIADAKSAAGKDKTALKKVAEDEKALQESTGKFRTEQETKLVEVLNDEQKKKFEELKKDLPISEPGGVITPDKPKPDKPKPIKDKDKPIEFKQVGKPAESK